MRWQLIAGAIGIAILLLATGFIVWDRYTVSPEVSPEFTPSLEIQTWGRAGDYGYVTYSAKGQGDIVLLGLNQTPQKRVFILSESDAIGAQQFDAFVDEFIALYSYGYEINVVSKLINVTEGMYIVPTGAMPAYALRILEAPNLTMIYFGQKDLLIQNGIKRQDWYTNLNGTMKNRLVVYETTLDDVYENNRSFLIDEILEQKWAQVDRKEWRAPEGNNTLLVYLGNATYLRLFYSFSTAFAQNTTLYDSPALYPTPSINATPASVFPGEKSEIVFTLNESIGNAFFQSEHNGILTHQERLGRIVEPQLFFFRPQFTDAGEYILRVVDASGERATGILHVKKLDVHLEEIRGNKYIFNITLDGKPLETGRITIRLNHSETERRYYIQEGIVTVPARLRAGENIFVIQYLQKYYRIPVQNERQDLIGVYIRYGIPGFVIVVLIFALARMARRPTYKVRFGDVGGEIRKDVWTTPAKALSLFEKIPKELGIAGPVTAKEFALALKRHVTEGAEITEGNVEALLKILMDKGLIENYRGYYQLRNRGNVRKNVLHRIVRELLIENGVSFTTRENVLVTRDFEIGFFGDRFEKKAYIILEDMQEKERIYAKMSEEKHAFIKLQEQTGKIAFVTMDRFKQIL